MVELLTPVTLMALTNDVRAVLLFIVDVRSTELKEML